MRSKQLRTSVMARLEHRADRDESTAWTLLRPQLTDVRRRGLSATQLFVMSFVGLIAVGTLGLLFLPGLYVGEGLGFIDALFTATSAVCVTGLIVVDTATYFSPLGQTWLVILIQLGGLGLLTFTTLVLMSFRERTPLEMEEAVGGHTHRLIAGAPGSVLRSVLLVTFSLEAAGALGFWLFWQGELGPIGAAWPAVFHAVSAFCNAGFSIFSDSLVGFHTSAPTLLVASLLIIVGGLGFVVIQDLRARFVTGERRRLTVHTRLVLASTAVLLIGGALLYLVFEWSGVLAGLPVGAKSLNAGFMSVTARTAGFNTVDYDALSNAALFLTVLLMLVGGSPNSTAGGFKTTTLALLGLLFVAKLRGDQAVSVAGRSVPEGTIQRAAGVVIGGTFLLGISVFLLLILESEVGATDRIDFLRLLFDAHSAFGTVGLSMGATPTLSGAGRLLISFLMFLGRVGPPTLVAAMMAAGRRLQYRYAHEDVIVG